LLHPPLARRMPRLHRKVNPPMTTPARHLRPVTWPGDDPVLAALRAARTRRDQADRDIRILLAYARELAAPRPYRPPDLAMARLADDLEEATRQAITGLRASGYSWADIAMRLGITRQGAQQRWADRKDDL